MKNILNQLDNVVLMINEQGRIQFANQPALNLLELTDSQIEELPLNELLNIEFDSLALYLNQGNIPGEYTSFKSLQKVKCYFEVTRQNWYETSCYMVVIRLRKKEMAAPLLHQLVESLPYSIWISDRESQFLYMNPSSIKSSQEIFPELAHLSAEDFLDEFLTYINNPEWISKFYDSNSQQDFPEHINKAHQHNEVVICEHTVNANDTTKMLVSHIMPLHNPLNNRAYTACITKDITLTKTLKEAGVRHMNELVYLKNLLHTPRQALDYSLLFNKLKTGISAELNADQIGLWLYEPENDCIRYVYDFSKFSMDISFPSVIPLSTSEIANLPNLPYLNRLTDSTERTDLKYYTDIKDKYLGFIGSYEIRSELNHQFFGILSVRYRYDNPPSLQQDYIIKNTCQQLALVLQNNMLIDNIHREFMQREKIEKELETFLSTAVDLTAVINFKTGQFIKANDKWQELLGWSSQELIENMRLQDLEHNLYHELSLHRFSDLNEEDYFNHQVRTKCCCKNGDPKLFEINYKRLPNEDLVMLTAQDITEKEKLKLQNKELEDVIRLESLRNEFFANVSHELRTPLNIIISAIQLLDTPNYLETTSSEQRNKYIKSMKQNAHRLLKLINNIIDITRIDAGYYHVHLGNYNIISLVETITDSTLEYMYSKNIKFTFDTEIEEEYIACDPDLIERILLNLLSNSIKYNKIDGDNKIWVAITLEEDYVVISVRDNGIGIPEEKLKSIFERFIQVDNLLTRKREGSGIGLSLVKSLVDLHKGHILVKSQLGEGSEFIVKLPRQRIAETPSTLSTDSLKNISAEKYIVEFSDISS